MLRLYVKNDIYPEREIARRADDVKAAPRNKKLLRLGDPDNPIERPGLPLTLPRG
jgi:hypothetical protein